MRTLYNISKYLNKKGFFDLLVARFLVQFLGFGTILFVTKFLSPEEVGQIRIIQSYAQFFIIIAAFGFNTSVLKICSEKTCENDKQKILSSSFKMSFLVSLATFVILWLLASNGLIVSSPQIAHWLIVYCTILPVIVATDLLIVFLQSQKKIKLMARLQALIKVQSAFIIIFSTWAWGFKGFIFSTILAFILGLVPLLWEVGFSFLQFPFSFPSFRFFKYSSLSVFANLVNQLGQRGEFIILDHLMQDREVIGYYSFATLFLMAATQVTGVVQQIITPYFSENSNDATWIRMNLKHTMMRMFALSFATALGIYFMAFIFINFLGSEVYSLSLEFLPIILVKYIVYSSYAIIGGAFVGLGFMGYNLLVGLISTPFSLFLVYWGVNFFGIWGVIWASVIASLFTACLMYATLFFVLKKYYPPVS